MNSISLAIGLTGIILTIIFGGLAFWLSVHFKKESDKTSEIIREMLQKIDVASEINATISKQILDPLIPVVLSAFRGTAMEKVDSMGRIFTSKLARRVEAVLRADNDEEKRTAQSEFMKELSSLLGVLRDDIGKVGTVFDMEALAIHREPVIRISQKLPQALTYDWGPFIEAFLDIEKSRNKGFFSLKWLRETKYAENKEYQTAIDIAVKQTIFITYFIPNSKDPEHPVKCCKLNPEHPIVIQYLKIIENKAKKEEKEGK